MKSRARAFAPASVGNVGVGFDLLGFSLEAPGDIVSVEKIPQREVVLTDILHSSMDLPKTAANNTATAGLLRLLKDLDLPFGFQVTIEKGIPLASGMGGSAASAVASLVAANALLDKPLALQQLVSYALIGEAVASGSHHADNVVPSLFGGLTLGRVLPFATEALPIVDVISIPFPPAVWCVLIHPHIKVETKQARGVLNPQVSLQDHVHQSGNMAGFIAGLFHQDVNMIRRFFADVLIEPQRAHLIPGFYLAQKAARDAGALGCTISGAGPSVFAWVEGETAAQNVMKVMVKSFANANVQVSSWCQSLTQCSRGARLL